jgi:hypothetical protein
LNDHNVTDFTITTGNCLYSWNSLVSRWLKWQQLFEHHILWSKQESSKLNMWYLQRKAISNSLHYCMPQEIVYHLLLLSLMLECMMLWWSMHQKEALVW